MPLQEALPRGPGVAQWDVWSTTARLVVTEPTLAVAARAVVEAQLAEIDEAASRFRDDSEIAHLAAASGRPVLVGPLLAELVEVALWAAAETDGAVDPTLGSQLSNLGYDRTFERLISADTARSHVRDSVDGAPAPAATDSRRTVTLRVARKPSWRDVRLQGRSLTVPRGVVLDLGATAKAWAADSSARLVAERLGCGVLVALGGDIAVAGEAPPGGWTILVQDGPDQPSSLVSLGAARGLATSSTLGRAWMRWSGRMHHILDPVTCRPAREVWRSVSVAAETCVAANVLTTAAIVRGAAATGLLRDHRVPARLVAADGTVTTLNGWPAR